MQAGDGVGYNRKYLLQVRYFLEVQHDACGQNGPASISDAGESCVSWSP